MFRSLKENIHAMIDLGLVISIGIVFVGLAILGFVLWTVFETINTWDWTVRISNSTHPAFGNESGWLEERANTTILNATSGFDSATNLILVAITIMILALAISALLLLRRR